jgi:hypothetical protein
VINIILILYNGTYMCVELAVPRASLVYLSENKNMDPDKWEKWDLHIAQSVLNIWFDIDILVLFKYDLSIQLKRRNCYMTCGSELEEPSSLENRLLGHDVKSIRTSSTLQIYS